MNELIKLFLERDGRCRKHEGNGLLRGVKITKLGYLEKGKGATKNNRALKLVLVVTDHSHRHENKALCQDKSLFLLWKCSHYLKAIGSGPIAAFVASAGQAKLRGKRKRWAAQTLDTLEPCNLACTTLQIAWFLASVQLGTISMHIYGDHVTTTKQTNVAASYIKGLKKQVNRLEDCSGSPSQGVSLWQKGSYCASFFDFFFFFFRLRWLYTICSLSLLKSFFFFFEIMSICFIVDEH